MKFTSILAFCAIAFTAVSASPIDTNARRMAAGLPPLKPRNMYAREPFNVFNAPAARPSRPAMQI